jgi:site-specific DNA-adenine methylase
MIETTAAATALVPRQNVGFNYPGGKQRLSPEIIKFLPRDGRKFIDLFAGRGNISFCAMQAGLVYDEWVLNDIRTYTFFQALQDHGDKVAVPHRSDVDHDELARYARRAAAGDPQAILLAPTLTFNGAGYKHGSRRTNGGRRTAESHQAHLRAAHKLLNERNVRITSLDWFDCLKAEKPDTNDIVIVDAPYLNAELDAYSPNDICPTELIEVLRAGEFQWVFTEYYQPLYVEAFGEPAYKKETQIKAANLGITNKSSRAECIWTNQGKLKRAVTVAFGPVPDDRTDAYYTKLSLEDLLKEIQDSVRCVSFHRNQMNKELRQRLLPALLALKKRTFRKKPGFYETLAKMGLNADTVRQWFYRSHTADEAIELLEEETPKPDSNKDGGRPQDASALLLEHADKMAAAVLGDKITYAKRLASEYMRVRRDEDV